MTRIHLLGILTWMLFIHGSTQQGYNFTNVFRKQQRVKPLILDNPCDYVRPAPPDFNSLGRSLSESKCYEYIWDLQTRQQEMGFSFACELYKKYNVTQGGGVGGRNSELGEFPHMGALGWRTYNGGWSFKCGSSLISKKFLLTAAHCSWIPKDSVVANSVPEVVRLGNYDIHDVFKKNPYTVDMGIKRILNHPSYKPPKKYYDIAIVELKGEVKLSYTIQPACIWPNYDYNELGSTPTITGWGVTKESGKEPSPILQVVYLDFIEQRLCGRLLSAYTNRHWKGVANHQLCAGKLSGGADACQGDSGGPLQVTIPSPVHQGSVHYVVGITSFGLGCARPNVPGIYTRVSSFVQWIEDVVWRGL